MLRQADGRRHSSSGKEELGGREADLLRCTADHSRRLLEVSHPERRPAQSDLIARLREGQRRLPVQLALNQLDQRVLLSAARRDLLQLRLEPGLRKLIEGTRSGDDSGSLDSPMSSVSRATTGGAARGAITGGAAAPWLSWPAERLGQSRRRRPPHARRRPLVG